MLFSKLIATFDEIYHVSSRNEIIVLLSKPFVHATAEEARIISYLSLGLLRAPYHGTQFALAEKSMLKIIALFLEIEETSVKKKAQELGDLALAYQELTAHTHKHDEIDLLHVYEQLSLLESITGTGSADERSVLLQKLLHKLSPLSGSYIIRIILGKMRLGFSDMTLLDALSWSVTGDKSLHAQLEHAYTLCADIGLIAYTLKKDGPEAIKAFTIHLGIPIRPAAAERANSALQVIERIGVCAAQPKIDGFRLQVHKKGEEIFFYSRNLLDMSDMFPDIHHELLKVSATDFIIEGEAVAYDQETGTCVPFQETIKRKRKHGVATAATEIPLTFIIFDILYAEGKSQLATTHEKRRALLLKLFGQPHDGLVTVIPEKIVDNAHDLAHYFNASIAEGFEGLVCKKPDSSYQAGKRNFNWIKLKRQEGTRISDTIDAVILGYYTGKGRRTSLGVGAFLVGAYDNKSDTYKTIAKVGTGLSDSEWRELKKECDAFISHEKPAHVVCPDSLAPSVWTAPALVCEIQADEITVSPLHAAGFALRFPRFIQIRKDKSPQDATTVTEIEKLYKLGLIKS